MPVPRPGTVQLRRSLFEEATEIVGLEYASDLALDDVARRVACSRRQLQRAFAEIGGTTFRDHVTGVRMEVAASMLSSLHPQMVREVANSVGYSQPAQFAKAFRRHHGVAPSAFRQSVADSRGDDERSGRSGRELAASPATHPQTYELRAA